jgi:type I restriction enzyme M protein
MSNASQQIVNKAWNFAHVLRDDGLSYMGYTEQITFLLFLKMADEQTKAPYSRPPHQHAFHAEDQFAEAFRSR